MPDCHNNCDFRCRAIGFLFFLFCVVCVSTAQSSKSNLLPTHEETQPSKIKVPKSILKSFMAMYPNSTPDFWILDGNNYEVQFQHQGKIKTAEYNRYGKWVNSETIVELSEVPEKTIEFIQNQFENYETNVIILEESPFGKFYSIGLVNDYDYQELIFDAKGNFISKFEFID